MRWDTTNGTELSSSHARVPISEYAFLRFHLNNLVSPFIPLFSPFFFIRENIHVPVVKLLFNGIQKLGT